MSLHQRVLHIVLGGLLVSCATRGEKGRVEPTEKSPQVPSVEPGPAPAQVETETQRLTSESEGETTRGTATFKVPAGWYVQTQGDAVRIMVPERDGEMVLVDLDEQDSDRAIAAAWKAVRPDFKRAAKVYDGPGRDGWDRFRSLVYEVAPDEKRVISATALHAGKRTLVQLLDVPSSAVERRSSDFGVLASSLKLKVTARDAGIRESPGTP